METSKTILTGFIILTIICLTGCSSRRTLHFADRQWHVSDSLGQIIDNDTTWRFTFGERLIPASMPIISSQDSADRYPGMEKFLEEVLRAARIDSGEILFFAPEMQTMFVRLDHDPAPLRPSSISANLVDEQPYTMWISDDDVEDWVRRQDEMYTYTYLDKRRKLLVITDLFDYGGVKVAHIVVFKSRDKATDRMGLPYQWTFFKHDLAKFDRDCEFWAHCINSHRKIAFANHHLGQLRKPRHTSRRL